MGASIEEIRDAVRRAKNEAGITGIEPKDIDAVAAVLAVLELIGMRDTEAPRNAEVVQEIRFPETFAEWASNYNISTHYDRFLAVMTYLYERGTDSVSTTDVHQMYDKARWKRPANAADVFAKGAERMFFIEAEEPSENEEGLKLWRITRTGYEHFESLRFEV